MNGTNARPLGETIAGTGPGIADDALAPGEALPTPPSDAEVAATARRLGVPRSETRPGDEAAPGTPGTGEDVCRTCNGSGIVDGEDCPTCDGTGVVTEGIGGG